MNYGEPVVAGLANVPDRPVDWKQKTGLDTKPLD